MNTLAIAARALRSYRRPLAVWMLALAALGATQVLFWPSIRQAPGLDDLVRSLPEALRALIGTDDLLSPEGFLASRLNSVFPLLITVYAAFRTSTETAGAEQDRAFEILLATPLARWELLAGRFLAVATSVLALMLATGAAMAAAAVAVAMPIGVGRIIATAVALGLLGVAFAGLTVAVAGATGARGVALGVGAGSAVGLFVLHSFSPIVPELGRLRAFTPFDHAIGYEPLVHGLEPFGSAVLLGITAAGLAIGLVAFQRRDVRG